MRTLFALFLSVLVAAPAVAQLAVADVALRVDDATVRAGDEVVVPVLVETDLDDFDVRSVTVVLRYSSSAAVPLAVETAGTLVEDLGEASVAIDAAAREVRVAAAGGTPLSGQGTLFNVRFRGETPTSVTVSFDPDETVFNEGAPPLTFESGRLTITPLPTVTISPPLLALLRGETGAVSAFGGAAPYTFASADPAVASVDASGGVTAAAPGVTEITATDADGVASSNATTVDVRGFDLSTDPVEVGQDETVAIDLVTTTLDGLDVRSGEIVLRVAPSVATFTGVETDGTLLDGATVSASVEGDRLRLAFASPTPIPGSGTLVRLVLQTSPSGSSASAISLPAAPVVNEDVLGLGRGLSTVRVTPPPTLSVTPASSSVLAGETVALSASGGSGEVDWTTSDPAVATVSADGVVSGTGSGTATITATDAELGGTGTATVTVFGVEVDPAEVTTAPGRTVAVPVALASPVGEPVESVQARFAVDRAGVAPTGVVASGRLAEDWSFSVNPLGDGSLEVAGAGPPITASGVFFDLEVTVDVATAPTTATVRVLDLLLNEGTPTARVQTGAVTVTDGTNAPPVAANDEAATEVDVAVSIAVLANDTDPDGDALTIAAVGAPASGTAEAVDGEIVYTPSAGFSGFDSFTYTVSDGALTDEATVAVTVTDPAASPDSLALVALYNATGGADWEDNANWLEGPLGTWSGVGLDADGRVEALDLSYNGLAGPLPPEIGDLAALRVLRLQGNALIGALPAEIGNLGSLESALLFQNELSGAIPAEIGQLDGLVTLGLGENDLSGELPAELGMLASLQQLDLNTNPLTGPLPDALGDLAALQSLVVTGTSLGGPIPLSFVDLAELFEFAFAETDLCEPTDSAFQEWLSGVEVVESTGVSCGGPPVAVDDEATTDEDVSVLIDVLANDTDPDEDPLAISAVGEPAFGTAAVEDGQIRYTPDPDVSGDDAFTYDVSDGAGGTDQATVTVTVAPVNDPPIAVADAADTDEDEPVVIAVLANDTDADDDALVIASVTDPASGTAEILAGGTAIRYTPAPDASGVVPFSYTVSDGNGGTDDATVTVTVTPVNDPPVAVDDEETTDEDTPVTIDALANDADVDGDTPVIVEVADPAQGTAEIIDAGAAIRYTPDPDLSGEDAFAYTISDGDGETAVATITVTVRPVNDPPIAEDDVASTDDATPVTVDVLANDSDVDLDELTVVSVTDPASGTAEVVDAGGAVRYTPTGTGPYSDAFAYTVSDGNGGEATATVDVVVSAAGAEPTLYTWTGAVDSDWAEAGNWSPEGVPTAVDTALVAMGPDAVISAPVAVATLRLTGGRVVANDVLAADRLALRGGALAGTADVTVSELVWTGADGGEVSGAGDLEVTGAATLAFNAATLRGRRLLLSGPSTLDPFESGSDHVAVLTLGDGAVLEVASGATLDVRPQGDSEDTGEISIGAFGGGDRSRVVVGEGAVLRSSGPGVATVAGDVELAVDGTLALDAGELVVRFAGPSPGRFGLAGDVVGTARLSLVTGPALDLADHFVNAGTTAPAGDGAVGVLTVASDYVIPDGGRLAVEVETVETFDALNVLGTVTLGGALDLVLLDGADVNEGDGFDVLFYGAREGVFETVTVEGLSDELSAELVYNDDDGVLTVELVGEGEPPATTDDAAVTDEDEAVVIDVLANDDDPEGGPLAITATSDPGFGSATTDGETVTYTPDPDATGTDTFTYTATDEDGLSSTATVTVTVQPVNDAPLAAADEATTIEDEPVTIDVLANDADVDGDPLGVVAVTDPASGTVAIGDGGADVTYTPAMGFIGNDAFTYTVSDGAGGEATAAVAVTVEEGPNTAPVAVADDAVTTRGEIITVTVLANDVDADGDALAVLSVGTPTNGTATTDGETVTYTPAAGFVGVDVVPYTLTDDRGATDTAPLTVAVTGVAASVTTFASRDGFDAAAPGLPVQSFEGAATGVACAGTVEAATDDACFDRGDILPGVAFRAPDGGFTVAAPGEGRPFAENVLQAAPGVSTVLDFSSGTGAVGLDVYSAIGGASRFRVAITALDGTSLGTLVLDAPEGEAFVGVVSTVPVGGLVIDEFPSGAPATEAVAAIAFEVPTAPPVVTTAPTTTPSTGTPSTITVDAGGFVPTVADLFYRVTGERDFASVPLSLVDGVFRADVPAAAVTPRGFDYYVVLSNGITTVTVPADAPEARPLHVRVATAPLASSVVVVRDGRYQMVSVPVALDESSVAAVFADDFGAYNPSRWRLLRWDPRSETYDEFGEAGASAVAPGRGFWLAARGDAPAPFDVGAGQSVDASAPVAITLPPGWSQIGTPFAFPVAWSDVEGADALPLPVAYDGTEYVPGQTVLEPWRGVFVENRGSDPVTVSVPPLAATGDGRQASAATYALQIAATAGDLRDTHNLVGFAPDATAGVDRLDWGEPPPIGEHVRLSVVEDGVRLARSLRPPGDGGAWDLALTASEGALADALDVTLVLDEQTPRADGHGLYLLDLDRGGALAVVEGRVRVPLTASRAVARLRVIVGTEAFARVAAGGVALTPAETVLALPRPNPARGPVHLDVSLAESGPVTLDVVDALGRRVAVLLEGDLDAGVHGVTWAARGVAAGVYHVRLRAGPAESTRSVVLVR